MSGDSSQTKGNYTELDTNRNSRVLVCHLILQSEIEELVSVFHNLTVGPPKLAILYKNLEAVRLAIADCVVLRCTK